MCCIHVKYLFKWALMYAAERVLKDSDRNILTLAGFSTEV